MRQGFSAQPFDIFGNSPGALDVVAQQFDRRRVDARVISFVDKIPGHGVPVCLLIDFEGGDEVLFPTHGISSRQREILVRPGKWAHRFGIRAAFFTQRGQNVVRPAQGAAACESQSFELSQAEVAGVFFECLLQFVVGEERFAHVQEFLGCKLPHFQGHSRNLLVPGRRQAFGVRSSGLFHACRIHSVFAEAQMRAFSNRSPGAVALCFTRLTAIIWAAGFHVAMPRRFFCHD